MLHQTVYGLLHMLLNCSITICSQRSCNIHEKKPSGGIASRNAKTRRTQGGSPQPLNPEHTEIAAHKSEHTEMKVSRARGAILAPPQHLFWSICLRTRAPAHFMASTENNRENFRILEKPVPSPTIHSQLRSWENNPRNYRGNLGLCGFSRHPRIWNARPFGPN